MKFGFAAVGLAVLGAPALAGPPYLTDDPVPTDTGHWEIYAPELVSEGSGGDSSGSLGTEINYGPLPDVQLTLDLPAAYARDSAGWHWGAGDLAVSVKYRFYHDEHAGVQIAAFPGVTLPTATNGLGAGRVTALLPIWAQKDIGPWSVFGGGGYGVNPGLGNRNFWEAAIAVTRDLNRSVSAGVEATRQGPDTVGGTAQTRAGIGSIVKLSDHYALLFSGGPTWADHRTGYHFYGALGLFF